jgi:hypothetical protein
VNLVGHGLEHALQKLPGGAPVRLFNELGYGELTRAIPSRAFSMPCQATETDKEIELSLRRLDFSNINVEEANGVALELLAFRFVPLDFGQARDTMPLQGAAMQRRSRHASQRLLCNHLPGNGCGIEGCRA